MRLSFNPSSHAFVAFSQTNFHVKAPSPERPVAEAENRFAQQKLQK
jgi:hypothetical protein